MNLDYVAGLFDGEGWLGIQRVKKSSGIRSAYPFRHQAYASIVIRERWLLEQVVETVGAGSLTKWKSANAKHSEVSRILWSGSALQLFLNLVGPRLIGKKDQFILVSQLVGMKTARGTGRIPTDDYLIECSIWDQMRLLNMKGVGKNNSKIS